MDEVIFLFEWWFFGNRVLVRKYIFGIFGLWFLLVFESEI